VGSAAGYPGGVKRAAFLIGLCIASVGAAGLIAPSLLVSIALGFVLPGALAFYALAAIRIAFGLLLVGVSPESRAPRAVRILGYVVPILGVTTAVAGLAAVDRAQGTIEAWALQDPLVLRLTAAPILALGSFVAYACAPGRAAVPVGPGRA
jgi:hypothetical protein